MLSEQPRYVTAVPKGVRAYPDAHGFLAGSAGRKSGMDVPGDIGGWDVANGFRLAETNFAGTPDSEWRISVLDRVVYAVLRRFPGQKLYTFDGPVWIIADVPEGISSSVSGPTIRSLMDVVERSRDQPDSLLIAINWIRTCFAVLEQAQLERLRAR